MEVAEIVSGETGIEGVQRLLSGRTSRQAIRGAIAPLLSNARLGPLYLRRAKLKPGRHLKVNFDAQVNSFRSAARSLRPIQVVWGTSAAVPDEELNNTRQALQVEAVRRDLAAPFQRLFVESPALGMTAQVWPLDPLFPQLVRLSDPQYVQGLLAELETGPAARKVLSPAKEYSILPVRYRPGERHVLRYDARETAGRGNAIFAKLYKNSLASSKAYQAAARVSDWLDERGDGILGARPLAHSPAEGAIFYPQVIGKQLSSYLKDPGGIPGNFLYLAGSILYSLHSVPAELAGFLGVQTFADEIRSVKRASEHVQVLAPGTGEKILEVLDRALGLYERLPHEAPTYTHSDYKADHLWVTSAGLTLIDFDTSSLRDPASDIGKFLADLTWWHVRFGKSGIEQAQENFLKGYLSGPAAIPEERLVRARVYEAVILVKIALRRIPIFDLCWADRTAGLIQQGEGVVWKLENLLGQPFGLPGSDFK